MTKTNVIALIALMLSGCAQGGISRDGGVDPCAVKDYGNSLAYFPCLDRLPEWRLHHAKVITVAPANQNGYTTGYWVVTE
jgi:hypothetical protein